MNMKTHTMKSLIATAIATTALCLTACDKAPEQANAEKETQQQTTAHAHDASHSAHSHPDEHGHHDNHKNHDNEAQSTPSKTAPELGKPAISSDATDLSVQINNAWVRIVPAISGAVNTAGYLSIHNPSDEALVLESVSSTAAAHTMVHDTVRDENGMMRMVHMDALTIPAQTTVTFKPKGLHIMLMGVSQPLTAGTLFPLTLQFKDKPAMTIKALIKADASASNADSEKSTSGDDDMHDHGAHDAHDHSHHHAH